MKNFSRLCLMAILCAMVGALPAGAQNRVSMKGTVLDKDTKTPVSYATVVFRDAEIQMTTNDLGVFNVPSLNAREYNIVISFLGYETLEVKADLSKGQKEFIFELTPANFRVQDIIVTAETGKAGAATASKISRTAIDHIQANSLADIMNLLPGATTSNSDDLSLRSVSTFAVRGGSSLGTAVIVDGSPMSNNANMQSMTSAISQTMPISSAMALPTSGIDMRQISTDNIESVEVIRGIASVEYGDITSGAVIVNSKAGRAPLNIKVSMNPNLYQFSANHGISMGENAGSLNYSADYTYSQYRPTEGYAHYERTNASIGYSNTIGKWYTNSQISLGIYRDKSKANPDDTNDYTNSLQKENRFRFNTKGNINFNKNYFKNIKYNASFTYTDKNSWYEDMAGNAEWSFSTSMRDGSILSSVTGSPVYLEDGRTLVTGMDSEKAWKTPNSYMYAYNVYGKEMNTYAQLMANFAGNWGILDHFLKIGVDFKSDGNRGEGKVYDPDSPPYRNLSWDYATQRERAYDDIPFMNTAAAFAELNLKMKILRRELSIIAGVRYDSVFNFDSNLAPRLNASYEIIPGHLSVRGGWGITSKVPTLALLHPQEAYFDLLNYDNSRSTTASDKQKFQVITTRVFDTENEDLEMATATKAEIGIDFKIGQVSGAITAFKDRSTNSYSVGQTLNTFKRVDLVQYEAVTPLPEDPNTLQALREASTTSILLEYSQPTNNSAYETKGLEAEIDFGRIESIRTRFVLDASWMLYKSWNQGLGFRRASAANLYDHVGILPAERVISWSEILSSNLKIIHNIPQIGFVVTLTGNVVWSENDWADYYNDELPIGYISATDGKTYYKAFTDADLKTDEFKMLDFRPELDERRSIKDSYKPALLCVNVNVTKEIKDYLRISFYANNAFRSTPLWESTKYPGSFTRRNNKLFYFGLSLTAIIK